MSILEQLSLWWTSAICVSDANINYPPTYLLTQEESRYVVDLEREKAEATEMQTLNLAGIHIHEMYPIRVIIHHGV